MPTAHLIHGYLGAGKTSFARQLEAELPAIRFSPDEWMARLYGIDPPIDLFADYATRIDGQIAALWPRCLALGLDVVLDHGFWSRAGRDAARALAASVGAEVRIYRLSCPDDVAWARVERRNAGLDGASLHIARSTFEGLRGRFEPLGVDEVWEEVTPLSAPPEGEQTGKSPTPPS